MTNKVSVFLSYAHEDETYRDALLKHLAVLRRSGMAEIWADIGIKAGENWHGEIKSKLISADVILMLISPDFIDSDFCYSVEMKIALGRHATNEAVVIPISIRHVDWEGAPFSTIQGLPVGLTPIAEFEGFRREATYAAIAGAIRQRVKGILEDKDRKRERDSTVAAPEVAAAARPSAPLILIPVKPPRPPDDSIERPDWASEAGRDTYGPWVRVAVKGAPGSDPVTQRLRWIPPGHFQMGSHETESERNDDEGPWHPVTISQGFWLMDTACTQALWQAVMGTNPSDFMASPDRPVVQVSWNDVQDFLTMINRSIPGLELTLPTEAQWEYACRAGTNTPFSFGATITPEQVNYNGNYPYAGGPRGQYRAQTVPVASLPANPWGLHEMHGNVWEWCLDGQRDYRAEAEIDPTGPLAGDVERVQRGGSWDSVALLVRAASRSQDRPGFRVYRVGFRCARVQS